MFVLFVPVNSAANQCFLMTSSLLIWLFKYKCIIFLLFFKDSNNHSYSLLVLITNNVFSLFSFKHSLKLTVFQSFCDTVLWPEKFAASTSWAGLRPFVVPGSATTLCSNVRFSMRICSYENKFGHGSQVNHKSQYTIPWLIAFVWARLVHSCKAPQFDVQSSVP